jgi:dihydropteroate synthase
MKPRPGILPSMIRRPCTRDELAIWIADPARPPLIMGILNVTPDSFSDGGRYVDAETAAEHAIAMLDSGAAIIDVGGESTRPGSSPVDPDEQIRRTVPVIRATLQRRAHTLISIDTTSAQVAQRAIDAGALIVNDISAGTGDERMFEVVRSAGAFLVLMHMQGTPQTMQQTPQYTNVVDEVERFLRAQIASATSHGIDPSRLIVDPGIGFGKTVGHNLELLAATRRLSQIGAPLLIGTSRKSFIGQITGETVPASRRVGSCVTAAYAVANGASIVRVHDVKETREAIDMIKAIEGAVRE